jgi:transcriptional regulator with XRE-family HTH domain
MAGGKFAKRFGERIHRLRVRKGLSPELLASRAGLHPTHISLIEHGARAVRIETIERLAIGLGVQPSRMMPEVTLRK